jgi:DNA-binding IclR family transcriptional regulator
MEARTQGFCMTSGLVDPYTHCLAAPIFEPSGRVVATLCFVVPVDTSPARIAQLRERLCTSARRLSVLAADGQRPATRRGART